MESVQIDADAIRRLDLSPLQPWAARSLDEVLTLGASLELSFDWPRQADDPRELAECPEPRLWALRADARHPWLPLVLERDQGSLVRHVAMVPTDSAAPMDCFDPEALEPGSPIA